MENTPFCKSNGGNESLEIGSLEFFTMGILAAAGVYLGKF